MGRLLITGSCTHRSRRLAALLSLCGVMTLAIGVSAQTPAAKPAAKAPAASEVDTVIALVKGGMSEATILKTLRRENKTYALSPADLLKLQKAGVSERIIDVMSDPSTGGGEPAVAPATATRATRATPAAAEAGGAATPFPPDLADVSAVKKRRLSIKAFDYSTVMNWVQYWFNNPVNIGEGIRAMLTVRMAQAKNITLVERANLKDVMNEQDLGASNRVKKGTNARIGQLSGADAMLMGDIVIFGRDDTTKRKGVGAIIGRFNPTVGAVVAINKEEKAVVGINLRLVDAENGEVIETAEARGESSRSSKDYAGVLGVKGVAVGAKADMTSSNFAQTIIGEATSNAVDNILKYLETKIPALPPKPREIEGRVATVTSNGAVLTVGSSDGVMRGDRFEVLKINGEIKDPATKEVIDLDTVKVGEFVADAIREKTSSGAYGGQPLSSAYATGKGYLARLVSK